MLCTKTLEEATISLILDLCTGSGIQLILGCKKACAKHGVGVDINDNACKIARINVSLNAMDEIIDIKSGDQ